ncbi:MAG: bifunctional nuclease family protein [Myxococcota bacterium]
MNCPILLLALLALVACSKPPDAASEVAVKVGFVAVDERAGSPVVLLEEWEGTRSLPIWIGIAEARSIASEMEKREPPRPNTHDLAKRLIEGLDATLVRVVVTELREGIYYATLVLQAEGRTLEIDSRPSDAIAIGLRMQAPLYARESLFEQPEHESDEGHAI